MDRIRVLLADDHAIYRRGVADILKESSEIEVVGEASDGHDVVAKARVLNPDVVLMDLYMPNCSGFEATIRLQAEDSKARVLVNTVSDKDTDLFSAMKAGARGYLLKDGDADELLDAIRQVARGGVIISPSLARVVLNELGSVVVTSPGDRKTALSEREKEVLQEIAKGVTNRVAAENLFISDNTVKTHLSHIMDKLHLANRSQVAAYAVQMGFIDFRGSRQEEARPDAT